MTLTTPLSLAAGAALLLSAAAGADPFPTRRGSHASEINTSSGFALRFGISVPKRVRKAQGLPLVLALHFGFDRSRPFPEHYGKSFMDAVIAPGLEDLEAVILAPDSHGRAWSDPEISAAVLELVEAAAEAYPIDRSRLVVTGYSMGGSGTWHFAAEAPELWSAALPIAARVDEDRLEGVRGVPVRALHSPDDELIPIAQAREAIRRLRARGEDAELVEAEGGITHFESPRFAPLLRASIPWLEERWRRQERSP
ncbi:MAG: hypothetical protein AAF725_09140 [Acidobacteriota bacterium]